MLHSRGGKTGLNGNYAAKCTLIKHGGNTTYDQAKRSGKTTRDEMERQDTARHGLIRRGGITYRYDVKRSEAAR